MEKMHFKNCVFGCLVAMFISTSDLYAATLTVPFPYPTIQSAINSATDGDTVLVHPGTYQETIDFLGKEITVESSGGASATTIDANQLDTVVYFWNGETSDTVLEGFTLTGGIGYFEPWYKQRLGGAIFVYQSYPTVRNCTLVNNSADAYGGAVYIDFVHIETITFENCSFMNNSSLRGGAIFCGRTNLNLDGCNISGNIASFGGGIEATESGTSITTLTMTDCVIDGNTAEILGGGMRLSQKGESHINGCEIKNNKADKQHGGGCIVQSQHNFINCTFTNNHALNGNGGAVSIASYAGTSPSFTGCDFSNNLGHYGGAIYASGDCTSIFTNCIVKNNFAFLRGGGINVEGCALTLNRCSIMNNSTTLNSSEWWHEGGGIWIGSVPSPTIANCIISGNTARYGGGITAVSSDVILLNSLVYANDSLDLGGGVYARTESGNPQIHNSIIWGNNDIGGSGESSQLRTNYDSAGGGCDGCPTIFDISHSIVENWSGLYGGNYNSGIDPRWVNPFGEDGIAGTLDDDLHLHPTSPCIDAGDNANAYGTTDIDGDQRFLDDPYTDDSGNGTAPIVDIGPYEFVVATIGDAGARLWMDSGMPSCMFEDTENWLPGEVPDAGNLAMFEVLGEANVCLSGDVTVEQLIIANGDVYIDLGGMTLTSLQEVLVAPFGGKIANLTVSGGFFGARNGPDQGTLVFDSLVLGGGGMGSFNLEGNVNLIANEIMMQYGASIDGEPTISSDIQNFGGRVRPGTSEFFDPFDVGVPGSMVIDGDYVQVGSPVLGSLPRYGSTEFDIDPGFSENPHDYLAVTGHATLGGILELNFDTSYVEVEDTFDVFSATSLSGNFDFLWTRGLQNGEVAELDSQFGDPIASDDFSIGQTNDIGIGSTGGALLNSNGTPTDMLVVDLDGTGGLDVVVSRNGASPFNSGVVEIYYDIYSGTSSTTSVTVGDDPYGLVAGDFDGDGDIDLGVVNKGSNSVSILTNNGTNFSEFEMTVVNEPVDLAVGNFITANPLPDLAVASTTEDTIEILSNTSSLVGIVFTGGITSFAGGPTRIDPIDTGDDKDLDLTIISKSDNTTVVLPGDGEGGMGLPFNLIGVSVPTRVPIGHDPLVIGVGDINGDGTGDTITINGDGSVSVRRGIEDIAATVVLGGDPRGLVVGDLDNDGDSDLVISLVDPSSEDGSQGVIIIRNDTTGTDMVTLTDLGYTFASGVSGSLIALGDVDGDGLLDIVAITESGGEADMIEYWIIESSVPTTGCDGDFDGSGEVDVSDLLILIGAWGAKGGEADLDGDGIVAIGDLLILIANWGVCPS